MNTVVFGLLVCLGVVPMALKNVGNVPYVDKTFEIYY